MSFVLFAPAIARHSTRMTEAERRERIRAHIAALGAGELDYVSEWLGYLPYGAYHWLEVSGRDATDGMPTGWKLADLVELEREGILERLGEERDPKDDHACRIRYRVR